MTTLALGPDGDGVDGSSWTWGSQVTLASITAAQTQAAMDAQLTPASLSSTATMLADGTSTGPQWWWWAYTGQTADPTTGAVTSGNQQAQIFLATVNPPTPFATPFGVDS